MKLRKRSDGLSKKLAALTKTHDELTRVAGKKDALLTEATKEKTNLQAKVAQLSADVKCAAEVGPGRYCPPRHPPRDPLHPHHILHVMFHIVLVILLSFSTTSSC